MSTTYYVTIDVREEPFELAIDESGKARCAFNITTEKRPSNTFLEEIAALLVAAGIGTVGQTIFTSTQAVIPLDPTVTSLFIIETGGFAPDRTHNSVSTPAYVRPAAQLLTRGPDYAAARTMARAAYNALVGIRNTDVSF